MKIPFDWLAELVDVQNITPEALAEELSLKAFEVEDIDWVGTKITGPLVAEKFCKLTNTQMQISFKSLKPKFPQMKNLVKLFVEPKILKLDKLCRWLCLALV